MGCVGILERDFSEISILFVVLREKEELISLEIGWLGGWEGYLLK